jgi:hypothetical protein
MVVTPTCISISSWQCITVRILHLSKTCMLHGERVITVMQLIFTSMPHAHGERSLLIRSAQEEISEIYILINVAFTCRPAAAHSPWPLLRQCGRWVFLWCLTFCFVLHMLLFFSSCTFLGCVVRSVVLLRFGGLLVIYVCPYVWPFCLSNRFMRTFKED